jgi:hypothetical protein
MKLTKSKLKQIIKEEMQQEAKEEAKEYYALDYIPGHVKQLYARIEKLEARLKKAGLA